MDTELIITSVGIAFSIIFSIITTFEMIRQRKASYKPKILPLNNDAVIVFKQESEHLEIIRFPNIIFKNIGLGTASLIEFSFSIDEKEFIKNWELKLGEKCPYVFSPYAIGYGKSALINIDKNRKVNINYLIQNDEKEIEIPYFIKYMLCDYILKCINKCFKTSKDDFEKPDIVFPSILLNISCRDFAGIKRKIKYSIELQVLSFSEFEVKAKMLFS